MRWWDELQHSASYVVARVRAAVFVLAALGASQAHDIATGLAWPESEKWILRSFTVCMGLTLLLRAGEKNDEKKP